MLSNTYWNTILEVHVILLPSISLYIHNIHYIIHYILHIIYKLGGTQWRSWLRHCATNRKVAVSIPDGVIRIFH
jgi:hypothetical protein